MDYKRTLTESEVKILNHDLLNIEDWINKAIDGKINSCLKRAAIEYRNYAKKQGVSMIPSSDLACVEAYFNCAEYKNRLQRDRVR